MNFLNSVKDIFMSIFQLLFVHDVDNPFYVVSVFIVVAIITITLLFRLLKYD